MYISNSLKKVSIAIKPLSVKVSINRESLSLCCLCLFGYASFSKSEGSVRRKSSNNFKRYAKLLSSFIYKCSMCNIAISRNTEYDITTKTSSEELT